VGPLYWGWSGFANTRWIHGILTGKRKTPKKILLVGTFICTLYLLFFSTATTAEEVSYLIDLTPTEKLVNSKVRVSREFADVTDEVPTTESTPTLTATPFPKERIVEISIESPMFNKWYESFWEDELMIRIPACSPDCSADEIISELGYAFSNDNLWVTVQIGRFFYAHSGWHSVKGPDFGDPFKRVVNEDSDIEVCFDEECYKMVAYVHLNEDEAREPVFVNDLFESIADEDIFIITCDSGVLPNTISPKIIVRLQPIN
jgi:hypothetical protein